MNSTSRFIKFWAISVVCVLASSYIEAANLNLLTNPGFENGTTGWNARGNGSDCTIAVSYDEAYSGTCSGKASGRAATWQGLKQSVLDVMEANNTYVISGWVKLEGASSDTITLSVEQKDTSGTHYINVASGTGTNTGWTKLSGTFTLDPNGTLSTLDIYFEGPASGVILYVDDANVYGPEPAPITPDTNTVAQIDTTTRYQTLEGFGAAGAWYENWLLAHPLKSKLYDLIFGDLGLDIYRIRNTYGLEDGNSYISNTAEIINNADASLGRNIKILMSSWSPPAYLKSDSNTIGGTLAKDANSKYRYTDFAQWWYDGLNYWAANGVEPDYISIQNEPDYLNSYWDCCKLGNTERSGCAGYGQALAACYSKISTMANPPKFLGPETITISSAKNYMGSITATQRSYLYGYAHHLYGDGSVDSPDGYLTAMNAFTAAYSDKPYFQTEFSKGTEVTLTFATDAMNLAKMMYNSLVVENASSYIYWELFWASPKGLISFSSYGSSSFTINPVYYAFKHFSAFTDPNWQRVSTTIGTTDIRTSAFISPDNTQLSIVLINTSTTSNIAVNFGSFTGFDAAGGYIYRSTSTKFCEKVGSFDANEYVLLPKTSITTIALFSEPTNCQQVQDFGYGLLSDLNNDCSVNYEDIDIIAGYWLSVDCEENSDCEGADFSPADGTVNFVDLSTFAAQWMQCNNPQQTGCITNW